VYGARCNRTTLHRWTTVPMLVERMGTAMAEPGVTTVKISNQRATCDDRTVVRRIAGLMIFVAATLAVASGLHLSGSVHGRSEPFDAEHAGVAEAIIGIVLITGAVGMVRAPARARTVGLATIGFATVGFLVGLNFTVRGGHIPDVAYHVALLPVLVGSLIVLLRAGDRGVRSRDHSQRRCRAHRGPGSDGRPHRVHAQGDERSDHER
jgi:hypothetical protein